MGAFVIIERRSYDPLMPPRLHQDLPGRGKRPAETPTKSVAANTRQGRKS
jgi:hypothetical protein